MKDKKWKAILAKNLIARHCANDEYVIERLKEIEDYLGTANLPSVESEVRMVKDGVCH
jgi:hypothetical protein